MRSTKWNNPDSENRLNLEPLFCNLRKKSNDGRCYNCKDEIINTDTLQNRHAL